jgi:hypothetical protein
MIKNTGLLFNIYNKSNIEKCSREEVSSFVKILGD